MMSLAGVLVGIAISLVQESAPNTLRDAESLVFGAALDAVAPAIVRIDTVGGALPVERGRRDDEMVRRGGFRPADGPTTGVVWSADGYIVTSTFNFVRDPSIITVTLTDGRRLVARLVARDRPASIALLKVDATGLSPPAWVEIEALKPGQRVIAAGFGHGTTRPAIAAGIISGLNRQSGVAVQTDARTSPAQYGGPLFDIDGGVIGVCVPFSIGDEELQGAQYYDAGVAFAIQSGRLRAQIDKLKSGHDVQRGLMGVFTDANDKPAGMRITAEPTGPAAAAGMKKGDIIVAIDGGATCSTQELRRRLLAKSAGERVAVEFLRDLERHKVEVTLVTREELPPPATQPASSPTSRSGE